MLSNTITVAGNIVDEPKLRVTKSGISVANFRVASTPRRWDAAKGAFVDGQTLFMNVSVWRKMAENVFASLHRGEPVVVTGQLCQRNYEVEEKLRINYEIAATAVGHDLSRGRTEFTKAWSPSPASSVSADENGLPVDDSAYWHDLDAGSESVDGASALDVPGGEVAARPAIEGMPDTSIDADGDLAAAARPLVPVG